MAGPDGAASRRVGVRPLVHRATPARQHRRPAAGRQEMPPRCPPPLRGRARDYEEHGRECAESSGEPRRLAGARKSNRKLSDGRRGGALSGGEAAYPLFRPAQPPEQKRTKRPEAAGGAFRNASQREQDHGKTPKRLVISLVCRGPVHAGSQWSGQALSHRMICVSRRIFPNTDVTYRSCPPQGLAGSDKSLKSTCIITCAVTVRRRARWPVSSLRTFVVIFLISHLSAIVSSTRAQLRPASL
jgi:hypothetical protein